MLRSDHYNIDLITITTQGDRDRSTPLSALGGVGVFAATLRHSLLAGEVDFAVHSYKDLPTAEVEGLRIAAIPPRARPHDALITRGGLTIETLPTGALVGTGSPRRAAQLLRLRPDLHIADIRGNVPTRLERVLGDRADLDAVVLAVSGLERLGLESTISEILPFAWAPAQGALAIETADKIDPILNEALNSIHDPLTAQRVCAERHLLACLNAGCAAPVGVTWEDDVMTGWVFSLDGRQSITANASVEDDPYLCARTIASSLIDQGVDKICDLHASIIRREL